MKTTIKNIFVKCPACHQMRGGNKLQHLEKWQKQYDFELDEKHLADPETYSLFWACDVCLKNGSALIGQAQKQKTGAFSFPFFSFIDREKTCVDCKNSFIFSKEEQRHWYEELGFIIFSEAKRCLPCRREQKNPAKQEISNLIPLLDLKDLNQTKRLITLYLQIDNLTKAKYYLAQARKANKSSTQFLELANIEAVITDYENRTEL